MCAHIDLQSITLAMCGGDRILITTCIFGKWVAWRREINHSEGLGHIFYDHTEVNFSVFMADLDVTQTYLHYSPLDSARHSRLSQTTMVHKSTLCDSTISALGYL